jgi:phospholipase/lecithinase/hemolysin
MNLLPTRWLLALLACALAPLGTKAGPYTDLVVFGDSLSDVGNTNFWTLGAAPGSNYYQGRFSNGPTYAERLSEGLGLGALTRDGAGGDNFAYGGAETNGPGGWYGVVINSLVEQVDEYLDRLGGARPAAGTLFVVFIGANDLLGGQTTVSTPANIVRTQVERLVAAGARQFLGVNLPLLGMTPRYGATGSAPISNTTRNYNTLLDQRFNAIEAANPAVTIHRLDLEEVLGDVLANAADLGFTNTTGLGRDASGGSLNGAPGYVFWDDVHPTREAHALLGEAAIRAVLPDGDYNRDGVLGAADYDAWRAAYGTTFNALTGQTPSLAADGNGDGRVDAADYTLWRDLMSAVSLAVPEPGAVWLVVAAVAVRWRRR